MSQNDTFKCLFALALVIMGSNAFAQAQPFKACVDAQLIEMGVNPAMQNRWNPNLIAGKLQIIAIQRCSQKMGSLDRSLKDTGATGEGQILPASGEPVFMDEADAAQGIREI